MSLSQLLVEELQAALHEDHTEHPVQVHSHRKREACLYIYTIVVPRVQNDFLLFLGKHREC